MAGSGEASMEEKLSDFRSLDSSQISALRSLFLAFSDRPRDQSHVAATVRRLYRDIPAESRGALGEGVLELFRDEERERQQQQQQREQEADAEEQPAEPAAAQQARSRQDHNVPRMTWKSFQRVCSALGLHLSDRRGQAAIHKLCPPLDSSNPAQQEPGLTFDDFMLFYASVSKPLSAHGELKQVWSLLDADLSGLVPLRVLRQCLLGFEFVSPSNTRARSQAFYDSNYKYHYSEAEKSMSSDQLVDAMMRAHFVDNDMEHDKINFAEFCHFMAS